MGKEQVDYLIGCLGKEVVAYSETQIGQSIKVKGILMFTKSRGYFVEYIVGTADDGVRHIAVLPASIILVPEKGEPNQKTEFDEDEMKLLKECISHLGLPWNVQPFAEYVSSIFGEDKAVEFLVKLGLAERINLGEEENGGEES